jgi:ketosteroid isomerase-like protein
VPRHIASLAISLWFAVALSASGAPIEPTLDVERDRWTQDVRSNPDQGTTATTATAPSSRDIDIDVWSVFVATVAADDIVRMGNVYFPNAVLVGPRGTKPIKETLEGWGRDMVAAKAKGNRATVEFRFSRRQDDTTTAFETGIFKYTVIEKSGASSSKFYPFEQLLAKTNGKWRVLMERQFSEVTQDAWDKLPK